MSDAIKCSAIMMMKMKKEVFHFLLKDERRIHQKEKGKRHRDQKFETEIERLFL